MEGGTGFSFDDEVVGGVLPREFVYGVERGLSQAKENGLLAGFPVIGFKATLIDGKYHDLDSSVSTFKIAAQAAFRELREKAWPKVVEPIMKIEVTTLKAYAAVVIGDLKLRRGMIKRTDLLGDAQVIIALAPLANMFGYGIALRELTRDQAQFTMVYDHYAPVDIESDPDLYPPALGMRA